MFEFKKSLSKRTTYLALMLLLPFFQNANAVTSETIVQQLFKRLTGTPISNKDPRYPIMVAKVSAGDLLGAAHIAADDDGFYNNTIKRWGAEMSNVSETPVFKNDSYPGTFGTLNDFTATVIGAVRDNWDARLLLSSDYYYKANPSIERPTALLPPHVDINAALTSIQSNMTLLTSNYHYMYLEKNNINLRKVLTPARQIIMSKAGNPYGTEPVYPNIENPDSAGLLTTRSFAVAHLYMGTNRRWIEFAFREFTCKPILEWADTMSVAPEMVDLVIRRDVDRAPGGDPAKFKSTCLACHGALDGMASATAHFDFKVPSYGAFAHNGYPVYQNTYDILMKNTNGVFYKHNKNEKVYPTGHEVKNNSWVNFATKNHNTDFGWTGKLSGNGVKALGEMIANSKAFTTCMARRVFTAMCKRQPASTEADTINKLSDAFVKDQYNLRVLFERAAVLPACLPQE